MPRRQAHFSQGCSYHIYNRGAGRHELFIEEDNYLYVLRRTKKYVDELRLTILAYCLMPNHYHFLIRQDGETAAGELPKRVFGGYSRAVNKRYGWSGTLFEGRYQAILVDYDAYVISLCRYIHANPVLAGLVDSPGQWPYSNYLEWIDERPGTLWDEAFVQTHFSSPADYAASVNDFLLSKRDERFPGNSEDHFPGNLEFPGK
jgi:REP element-mobilizing transposase RayT